MSIWQNAIATGLTSAATFGASFLLFRSRKTELNQTKTTSEWTQVHSEIDRLRTDIDERDRQAKENYEQIQKLRFEVLEWQLGVLKLIGQLHEHKIAPAWVPPTGGGVI